jgi:hypothetical protein
MDGFMLRLLDLLGKVSLYLPTEEEAGDSPEGIKNMTVMGELVPLSPYCLSYPNSCTQLTV